MCVLVAFTPDEEPSARVRVSTRHESAEVGVGEAVEWVGGEWHESRSLEPSTLLIVEGAFE